MVGSSHFNFGSKLCREAGNSQVIGGDQHLGNRGGLASSLPNPLQEWFACNHRQGFAWETGRGVAGGYDSSNSGVTHWGGSFDLKIQADAASQSLAEKVASLVHAFTSSGGIRSSRMIVRQPADAPD